MVSNAQLHNEKTTLFYQVDALKDKYVHVCIYCNPQSKCISRNANPIVIDHIQKYNNINTHIHVYINFGVIYFIEWKIMNR